MQGQINQENLHYISNNKKENNIMINKIVSWIYKKLKYEYIIVYSKDENYYYIKGRNIDSKFWANIRKDNRIAYYKTMWNIAEGSRIETILGNHPLVIKYKTICHIGDWVL